MTSDTFEGIPKIGDGDYSTARSTVRQRPASELKDAILGLFELEHIVGLRWNQYIPRFNDGDVCEFTVSGVSVSDSRAPEDAEWVDHDDYTGMVWLDSDSYADTVWFETGEVRTRFDGKVEPVSDYREVPRSWSDQKTVDKVNEVMSMIGAEFYDALEENFGSYAEVTFMKVDGELKVFVESCEAPY